MRLNINRLKCLFVCLYPSIMTVYESEISHSQTGPSLSMPLADSPRPFFSPQCTLFLIYLFLFTPLFSRYLFHFFLCTLSNAFCLSFISFSAPSRFHVVSGSLCVHCTLFPTHFSSSIEHVSEFSPYLQLIFPFFGFFFILSYQSFFGPLAFSPTCHSKICKSHGIFGKIEINKV